MTHDDEIHEDVSRETETSPVVSENPITAESTITLERDGVAYYHEKVSCETKAEGIACIDPNFPPDIWAEWTDNRREVYNRSILNSRKLTEGK